MEWYQLSALAALGICLFVCLLHVLRLIRKGIPVEFARHNENNGEAVLYAFTGAMSPKRKESAFLHTPTYTAGLIYHMGTFLSFFLFFFILAKIYPQGIIAVLLVVFLSASSLSGIAILIKRILKKELRLLSNPDDFISNLLVTFFQLITLVVLVYSGIMQHTDSNLLQSSRLNVLPSYSPTVLQSYSLTVLPSYYLLFTLLLLYVPVGKLRHMVYFFAARYHLGLFYGRRGVWPAGKTKN